MGDWTVSNIITADWSITCRSPGQAERNIWWPVLPGWTLSGAVLQAAGSTVWRPKQQPQCAELLVIQGTWVRLSYKAQNCLSVDGPKALIAVKYCWNFLVINWWIYQQQINWIIFFSNVSCSDVTLRFSSFSSFYTWQCVEQNNVWICQLRFGKMLK